MGTPNNVPTVPASPTPPGKSVAMWSSLFTFTGDSMPSYIVQSFLADCLLYPKIILHKDFQFFREYLSTIGMAVTITCYNGIYVENHEDHFFCVELEKKLLKEILHREDFVPEEGAWSSVSRLEIRKKLGLGIWKWEMPNGIMEILELFISFCKIHYDSFKLDPEMKYFLNFVSKFSLERGFDTEEIYFYEKADEKRKRLSGYVSPSDDDLYNDGSDDDSSVSSVEFFDSDFNPKKRYSAIKGSNGKGKAKKQSKGSNSPVRHRNSIKAKPVPKPKLTFIRCPQCGNRYKYRTALNKHIMKEHGVRTKAAPPKTTSSCVRKLTYPESDDEMGNSESEGDSDSSCQIIYTKIESKTNNSDGKRFSTLRTSQGRATVRHQLKEIANDLNIRKTNSRHKDIDYGQAKNPLRRKLIKCSECSMTYQYLTSLRKHIRNVHSSKSVVKSAKII